MCQESGILGAPDHPPECIFSGTMRMNTETHLISGTVLCEIRIYIYMQLRLEAGLFQTQSGSANSAVGSRFFEQAMGVWREVSSSSASSDEEEEEPFDDHHTFHILIIC